MKIILLLFFFTTSIYGQNSEIISDEELCDQIKLGIDYIKADKELKTRNFRFDSKIGNGWNYELYFSSEYVAFQLDIEKDKVFELDKTKTFPIYKKLESTTRKITDLKLDCVKKKRKPNVGLSKLDRDNLLIDITTTRVGKEGSSGRAYLFFFDDGKIVNVEKEYWIE